MSCDPTNPSDAIWWCGKCDVALEMGKVNIGYLGSMFPVDLLRCPKCGQAFIPEELAMGKIAEVEKLLEDK
ncbi:MAG: DVU_1557 family redox protein [Desulfobaccales bacterium]|jgi:ribosomal protein S27AE